MSSATINSEVAMGRRMKMRDKFMAGTATGPARCDAESAGWRSAIAQRTGQTLAMLPQRPPAWRPPQQTRQKPGRKLRLRRLRAPVAEERPPLFLRHLGHLFTLLRGQAGHQGCAAGTCVLGGSIRAGGSAAVNHGHLGAFAQAVDAIGHHLVTVLQFTLHAHAVAVHHTHTNAPLGHGAVGRTRYT